MGYALLTGFAAGVLQPEYAAKFIDCSDEDIIRIMKSFSIDNCNINNPYMEILRNRLLQ
jgi:predicted small secreted protein